jgi:hypothetical protein
LINDFAGIEGSSQSSQACYRLFSQRPEFGGDRLAERFGARYQRRGHELGGRGHTTPEGIERLGLWIESVEFRCVEERS